ncbi:histidine kinase [Hymenobacter sp. ASUV-10]|uniref:histidine kinase n=1 Tax=Hymenobacter aranciens TaxID=3063996 RepID=A0ABT9BH33_9BACT|nr:histidine kinase [Hymenobacter sp. ASUV-10]MDO7877574.1 histidine kinase [Hymenobacter sp. ASUV-10]
MLLLPLSLRAQRTKPDRMPDVPMRLDSQQAWLRRPRLPDSTRVKLLISCCFLHLDTRLDSARWYSEQAVALARRSGFAWGHAYALLNLAAAEYYASDYPAAQRTFEMAVTVTRHVGQLDFIGHAYLGLGNVASELHNAAAAQRYFTQAQQFYARCQPRFVGGELLVLHNRANLYLDSKDFAQARALVQQALVLLKQHPGRSSLAKLLVQLGEVQHQQQHPDSAATTWQRAARLARTDHDAHAEGEAWHHLAQLAQEQRHHPTALAYAERATSLLRSVGATEQLANALDTKASALAALHRPEAYDTLRRYTNLRDTLLSQQRLEAVANAQARFEQAEQRARIRALEQQRRIANLETEQRTFRSRLLLGGLAAGGLLLGGAFMGAYRRRQRRREAALRHQLAADLHDDVGSLLSRIALQTDLLQEGLGEPGQQQTQLAEVAGNSRLAVRQLNDVVWNLDAQNDSVPNLLSRLRDYAHELLVPTGRDVQFVADEAVGASADLSPLARRQLYLIYKEALHNILKYAPLDATVTVTLHRHKDLLTLDVVNTGPVITTAIRDSGHGLRNMQARAATLGGTATAEALAEGGFAVRVRVKVG